MIAAGLTLRATTGSSCRRRSSRTCRLDAGIEPLGLGREPQRREQADADRLAVRERPVRGGDLDGVADRVAQVEDGPATRSVGSAATTRTL